MLAPRFVARVAIIVLIAFGGPSCSTLATIERRSGPTMEAKIDSSDGDRLYVTDTDSARYSVERADIVDIHHPGHPAMTTGAILLGGGAFAFAIAPAFDRAHEGFLEVLALAYGIGLVAAGLPLFLYGVGTNMRSHEAAKVRPRTPLPVSQQLPRLPCPACQ